MDRLILNIEKRPALETIFSDLESQGMNNAKLIHSKYTFDKGILKFLYKVHHSRKLNKIFKLPLKKIWDRFCPLLRMQFDENDEYYVVFIEWAALQYTHEELRRLSTHKNVHLCLLLFNPMEGMLIGDSPFKKMFYDVKFEKYFAIFDERDIKKENFQRISAIYSKLDEAKLQTDMEESDFFYIGMAKDRQSKIQDMYRKIVESGKTADFTIVSPDPSIERVEGIQYLDDFLDYEVYLQHVYKTKCIVELLQGMQHGMTLRTFEAIVYGKHLLSNNDVIENVPYYSPEYMHYITEIEDIDINNIELTEVDYGYKGEFSPKNLLDQILK
ncbi:MAG: hypothetical protein IJZ42_05515 [Lachnospiraceae bacterium]|nr:hypothetical protein [Lachnospiraceae bacterium]